MPLFFVFRVSSYFTCWTTSLWPTTMCTCTRGGERWSDGVWLSPPCSVSPLAFCTSSLEPREHSKRFAPFQPIQTKSERVALFMCIFQIPHKQQLVQPVQKQQFIVAIDALELDYGSVTSLKSIRITHEKAMRVFIVTRLMVVIPLQIDHNASPLNVCFQTHTEYWIQLRSVACMCQKTSTGCWRKWKTIGLSVKLNSICE